MKDLYKDILTGLVFMIGLLGFLSGEFIISSTLFAASAIASNVSISRKRGKAGSIA
jgi:CheY-specific phosphatase CheX